MSASPSLLSIHEAAHAVIALHFGFHVAYAQISSDGTGEVRFLENLRLVDPDEYLVVVLAGKAAERLIGRECHTDVLDAHAASDLQTVRAWTFAFHGDTPAAGQACKDAERTAWALVLTYEPQIRAFAVELDTQRLIGSREVRAFVEAYAQKEMVR